MKKILNNISNEEISRKNTLIWVCKNQHPAMYWWFALTSLSLCSVYVILFTTF